MAKKQKKGVKHQLQKKRPKHRRSPKAFSIKSSASVQDSELAHIVRSRKSDFIKAVERDSGINLNPGQIRVSKDGIVTINDVEFVRRLNQFKSESKSTEDTNVFCNLIEDLSDIEVDVFCGN